MTEITITGSVAERLQHLAQRTHRTVEDILEEALDMYMRSEDKETAAVEPREGSLARMAWVATHQPIEVQATDISERSRDILRREYADHLLKHQVSSNDAADE